MSLRSKLDNIWYHYKVHIIIGLFAVFTVVFALQSCVTRQEYDIKVYYVSGSAMYTEQLDWVRTAVAEYCGDANGDGEVNVAVTGIRVGSYSDASSRAEYMTAVQAGEVFLFFGDQEGIQYLYDNNYLQPLTDFSASLDANGYAWKVNGTDFSALTKGFEMFSDVNLYVALRASNNTWASATSSGKKNYDTACTTIANMMAAEANYDLSAYFLSAAAPLNDTMVSWVKSALTMEGSDKNGDGKKIVDVTGLDLLEPSTLEKYKTAIATSKESFLIVGDEAAIALLAQENLLESVFSQSTDPTGCGWLINGSTLVTKVGSEDLFRETKYYLALRRCPVSDDGEMLARHTYAKELFAQITGIETPAE